MSESVSGTTIASNGTGTSTTHGGRSAANTSTGGRGSQGGRGRGNTNTESGRGKKNKNRNTNNDSNGKKSTGTKTGFKGNTTELHGNVFELYEESGDRTQFSNTLEVLGQYASKTLKFSEDMRALFKEPVATPTIDKPQPPADPTDVFEKSLFDTDVRSY